MDEPLSNLDAQLRQEMRREIRALQQQLGMTMVYVTHDQTEAMSMADQVVLLSAGRIEQDAPPADLYARPATVFAARFIGTPPMNIIAAPGRPDLKLGVRPEHVRVVAERRHRRRSCRAPNTSAPTPSSRARHRPAACSPTRSPRACRAASTLAEGARLRLGWARRGQPTTSTPRPACRRDDVVPVPA